jgi:SAM-dependent methyltransferase
MPFPDAKARYHRYVPARLRNAIGLFRRGVADRVRRARERLPLPPAELLRHVQLTPYVKEYLDVGARSARSIREALVSHPPTQSGGKAAALQILDFGCGSGRTLRHLRSTSWELFGCDIDRDAIRWCRDNLPFATFAVNEVDPPLPYDEAWFDAVYAVSVFTHFPPDQQPRWAAEMARVIKPGGLLAVSSVGFTALAAFADSPSNHATLEAEGMLFLPGDEGFNNSGAFHSGSGLARLFAPHFDMLSHAERGLDGFQDLTVLRRR